MSEIPVRLGQILLAKQVITEQQLELALQYQARHNKPVGHCLMALGFIEQKDLNRALRRQSWLKPCAACLTCLCAPFTFSPCYADESTNDDINDQLATVDVLKVAAEAAWGIYQGEPRAGEWQYSLSKPLASDGYAISIKMHF